MKYISINNRNGLNQRVYQYKKLVKRDFVYTYELDMLRLYTAKEMYAIRRVMDQFSDFFSNNKNLEVLFREPDKLMDAEIEKEIRKEEGEE